MTKVLVYLPMLPPAEAKRCYDFVCSEFPALEVARADKLGELDPHIGEAEILITFGAHLGLDAESILGRGRARYEAHRTCTLSGPLLPGRGSRGGGTGETGTPARGEP